MASRVQALIQQVTSYSTCKQPGRFYSIGSATYNLSTRVNFTLYPARTPRAVLSGSPPSRISVARPTGAGGNAWSDGWVACRSDGNEPWSAKIGVPETINGSVIRIYTSGCDPKNMVVEMAAGWAGYPVAIVSYKHGQAP